MLPANYSSIEFLRIIKRDLLANNMYQDYRIKLPLIPIRKGAVIYINVSIGIDNIINDIKV